MTTRTASGAIGNAGLRELARRSGDGIDVALLWESGDDRVFSSSPTNDAASALRSPWATTAHSTSFITRTPTAVPAFRSWVPGYDRA